MSGRSGRPTDDEALVRDAFLVASLQAAFAHPTQRGARTGGTKAHLIAVCPPTRHTLGHGPIARPPRRLQVRKHGRLGVATTAVTLATIIGLGGAAAASTAAVPGDALYVVKGVVEGAWVASVAGDDDAAARVQARLAQRRLDEVEALQSRTADGRVVQKVLAEFEDHAARARNLAPAATANKLTALQLQRAEMPPIAMAAPGPPASAPSVIAPPFAPLSQQPSQTNSAKPTSRPIRADGGQLPVSAQPVRPEGPHSGGTDAGPGTNAPGKDGPAAPIRADGGQLPVSAQPVRPEGPHSGGTDAGPGTNAPGKDGPAAPIRADGGQLPVPAQPARTDGPIAGGTAARPSSDARRDGNTVGQRSTPSTAPSADATGFDRNDGGAATLLAKSRAAELSGSLPPLEVRQQLQLFLVRLGYAPALAHEVATNLTK